MSLKFRVGEVVGTEMWVGGEPRIKKGVILSTDDKMYADLPIRVRMEDYDIGEWCYKESDLIKLDINAGSFSKATTSNPKDLLGSKKVSITKLPMAGVIHGAHAMMDGAAKYGPFNWREKDVVASIYVDAALRHLAAWFEREEIAEDSGVHHLGHAIACAAILLDAQENGNLIDDRPNSKSKDVMKQLLNRLAAQIKERAEKKDRETK